MPGYNHYPDCTCGWCVNYGRSRTVRTNVKQTFAYRDARQILKQHNANSAAGCYVNPNARCPVCNAPVFFYANPAGSRVYFDDLGPPWPKHPCTDNGPQRISSTETLNQGPTRRPVGQVKELLAAAQRAGLSKPFRSGQKDQTGWSLAFVHAARRLGNENQIEAEHLDDAMGGLFSFSCFSDREFLSPGDFISIQGNQVSCVDRESLMPVLFKFGAVVEFDKKQETPAPATKNPALPLVRTKVPSKHTRLIKREKPAKSPRVRKKSKREQTKVDDVSRSKIDMQKSEMVHFDSKEVAFEELYRQLEPVIKQLAREGTRKPRDVAPRLNFLGYRTAAGSKWTARLVYFLLALIFNNATSEELRQNRTGKRVQASARPMLQSKTDSGSTVPLTKENIAERLASLGTVSIKGKVEK